LGSFVCQTSTFPINSCCVSQLPLLGTQNVPNLQNLSLV
jgi:hypothetical protein